MSFIRIYIPKLVSLTQETLQIQKKAHKSFRGTEISVIPLENGIFQNVDIIFYGRTTRPFGNNGSTATTGPPKGRANNNSFEKRTTS